MPPGSLWRPFTAVARRWIGPRHGTRALPRRREQLTYLRVPFPEPIAAVDRLVESLRALEAAVPADPLVPTHGAFRPEQVLLADKQISIIDFDYCCMAEPAFDIALFRATTMDNGLYDEQIRPRDEAEVATPTHENRCVERKFSRRIRVARAGVTPARRVVGSDLLLQR